MEGTWLALYPLAKLREEADVQWSGGGTQTITLARNVGSPAEVDAALAEAERAGAALVKPAAETFWGGYSGYFSDPDGYLWEVAHNPFTDLT